MNDLALRSTITEIESYRASAIDTFNRALELLDEADQLVHLHDDQERLTAITVRKMKYILRIVNMDESFDSDSVEASSFYGPFATREAADAIGEKVVAKINARYYWADLTHEVIAIDRPGIRKIIAAWSADMETVDPGEYDEADRNVPPALRGQ